MYYYHLWLVEIPHLKFLLVPQLSLDVFRASNATSIGGSSLSADSDDWQTARSSSHATTSTRRSAHTKKTIKTETADNVASHFHTMEAIQSQNVEICRQREKREGQLLSTLELKAVEEMIVMKREELRGLNDSNDADDKESEEEFLRKQLAKLRKRQQTLMALIYTSNDDNDNDN